MSKTIFAKIKFEILLFLTYSVYIVLISGCSENLTEPQENELQKWNGELVNELVGAVLKPDSTVWLWGGNYSGTLGNGTTINSDNPVKALNLEGVVSIDLSLGAAFAADNEGNIWYWGNYITYIRSPVTTPVKIAFLKDVVSIKVFNVLVYLLTKNGSVYYMRMDEYTPTVTEGPYLLQNVSNVIAINNFSALTADGRIYILHKRKFLTEVPENIISAQSAQCGNVVLKNDGTVWACGDSIVPTKFNISEVFSISYNYGYCSAIKKDGTVWLWYYYGNEVYNTPVKIEGLENVKLIYASTECLAMKNDGTYWTFSFNERIPKQVIFN